jgi:hypothetical protein
MPELVVLGPTTVFYVDDDLRLDQTAPFNLRPEIGVFSA